MQLRELDDRSDYRRGSMDQSSHAASCNALSVILAGGRGSRLYDLTDHESKPALPIGPQARLIDFTLANVVNSGIDQALLLTQYEPESLHRHLHGVWGPIASQKKVSIGVMPGEEFGPYLGTAHAVSRAIEEIDRIAPRHVVILAGDHLYQMDYRPFIQQHERTRAQVTVGVVHVPVRDALEFGVMTVDAQSRIIAFAEKPAIPTEALDRPGYALASMGIYVFDWDLLRGLLVALVDDHEDLDFGKHIIPFLVREGHAHAYALPSMGSATEPFWKDLGTLDAYHGIHGALIRGDVTFAPNWPLLIETPTAPAAKADGALTSPAALIEATDIYSCSIAEGAFIGARSVLRNSVVLPGAKIGRNVVIENAIITSDAVIRDGFNLAHALQFGTDWCTTSHGRIRVISARALKALDRLIAQKIGEASQSAEHHTAPSSDNWTAGIRRSFRPVPAT
jgi:glucose-1-phosphate adenylyltransferase